MTMTSNPTSTTYNADNSYIARDDVTEQERLIALGGFGAAMYDDATSLHDDLAELGLYVNPDN